MREGELVAMPKKAIVADKHTVVVIELLAQILMNV